MDRRKSKAGNEGENRNRREWMEKEGWDGRGGDSQWVLTGEQRVKPAQVCSEHQLHALLCSPGTSSHLRGFSPSPAPALAVPSQILAGRESWNWEPEVTTAQPQASSPWHVCLHSQRAWAEQVGVKEESRGLKSSQARVSIPALPHGLFSTGLVEEHSRCAPGGGDDLPASARPLCSLPTLGSVARAGLGWSQPWDVRDGDGAWSSCCWWERGLWEGAKWEKSSGK